MRDFYPEAFGPDVYDMVVADDGRTFVLGRMASFGSYVPGGYAVVGFEPDGSLIEEFGLNGVIYDDSFHAWALALQGDRVLVAGGTEQDTTPNPHDRVPPSRFVVTRFRFNGARDRSFGDAGFARLEHHPRFESNDVAGGIDVQPDGRIVIAGGLDHEDQDGIMAARLLSNGRPDPTFGARGLVAVTTDAPANCCAFHYAIEASSKILIGGYIGGRGGLVRLLPNGSPDPGFGGGDGIFLNRRLGSSFAQDIKVQPDGRILAGGGFALTVLRVETDGTLDTSFGNSGVASIPDLRIEGAGFALQPDGSIIAGGSFFDPPDSPSGTDFVFARYTSDGDFDDGFGLRRVDVGSRDNARDVDGGPGGRVLTVGVTRSPDQPRALAMVSLAADGTPDPTFGNNGTTAIRPPFPGRDRIEDVALQGPKVVAVGRAAGQFAVVRFGRRGARDRSFGGDGTIRLNFPGGGVAEAVALQKDGRVVVVGRSDEGAVVVRLRGNGYLDGDFGEGGIRLLPQIDGATDVEITPGGSLLVGGSRERSTLGVVFRLTSNGSIDRSYGGGDGIARIGNSGNTTATDVELARTGKKLFAALNFLVVRLNGDGSRDRTFGDETYMGPGIEVPLLINSIDPASRGFVLAGRTHMRGGLAGVVARFRVDGSPVRRFGTDGAVWLKGRGDSSFSDVVGMGRGGYLAVGWKDYLDGWRLPGVAPSHLALVRFRRDGSRVRAFGRGGLVVRRVGQGGELRSVAVDGRAAVAGGFSDQLRRQEDFVLMKFRRPRR